MREIIDSTDFMESKIMDIYLEQVNFDRSLDLNIDHKICQQRLEIKGLYNKIHELELKLEKTNEKEQEMINFSKMENTQQDYDNEIMKLKVEFEEIKNQRKEFFEKLQEKHENSIELTNKRAELIISDVENVAAQNEINNLSEHSAMIIQKNKEMKLKVDQYLKEYLTLCAVVEDLEMQNRDLVTKNVGVDWNLIVWNGNDSSSDSGTDDEEKQEKFLELDWLDKESELIKGFTESEGEEEDEVKSSYSGSIFSCFEEESVSEDEETIFNKAKKFGKDSKKKNQKSYVKTLDIQKKNKPKFSDITSNKNKDCKEVSDVNKIFSTSDPINNTENIFENLKLVKVSKGTYKLEDITLPDSKTEVHKSSQANESNADLEDTSEEGNADYVDFSNVQAMKRTYFEPLPSIPAKTELSTSQSNLSLSISSCVEKFNDIRNKKTSILTNKLKHFEPKDYKNEDVQEFFNFEYLNRRKILNNHNGKGKVVYIDGKKVKLKPVNSKLGGGNRFRGGLITKIEKITLNS
ncbi:hypothetical protein HDU92_005218 [Lobulomyces angularis]|nr:hypothetical protein HDU92_005218 [Lobulomyces angularis]